MTQERWMPGSELARMEGEVLTYQHGALYLTNRRLIASANNLLQSAFIEDVDYGGFVTRSLPLWVLISGIVLAVFGVGILNSEPDQFQSDDGHETFGFLILLLGGGLGAAWMFVRSTYLVFSVSGADKFEVKLSGMSDPSGDAARFINHVFAAKSGEPPPAEELPPTRAAVLLDDAAHDDGASPEDEGAPGDDDDTDNEMRLDGESEPGDELAAEDQPGQEEELDPDGARR